MEPTPPRIDKASMIYAHPVHAIQCFLATPLRSLCDPLLRPLCDPLCDHCACTSSALFLEVAQALARPAVAFKKRSWSDRSIMEAFGLEVSDSEAIDVDSSSAEEGRHLSPSHQAVKRRLSGAASGSSPGVRAPNALTKEWVHHSDGRRQRINSKGHIESFDGVRGRWPSDEAMSDEEGSPSIEEVLDEDKEGAEEEAKAKAEEEAKDKAEEQAKDKAEEEAQDKAEDKPEEEAKLQAGWAAAKARALSRVSCQVERLLQKKPAMGKAEEDSPSKEDSPGLSEELKPEEAQEPELKPKEAVAKAKAAVAKAEEAVAKAKAKAKAKDPTYVKRLLTPTVKMRTVRATLQSYIQIWDAEEQRWVLLVSISKKMSPDHSALITKIALEIQDGTGSIGDKEAAVQRRDFLVAYGF